MLPLDGQDLFDDHTGVNASVGAEHADRVLDRTTDDLRAESLVAFELEGFDGFNRAEKSDAAAGDDTLFHSSAGRVQRVFQAGLLFLHLNFGGSTDVDDGDTTCGSLAKEAHPGASRDRSRLVVISSI